MLWKAYIHDFAFPHVTHIVRHVLCWCIIKGPNTKTVFPSVSHRNSNLTKKDGNYLINRWLQKELTKDLPGK